MSDGISLRIAGLPELKATGRRAAAIDLGSALVDAATPALNLARATARRHTGAMAGSIRAQAVGTGRAELSAGVRYAPFQHYGTARITPNPFLTQPLRTTEAARLRRVEDQLVQLLHRAGL